MNETITFIFSMKKFSKSFRHAVDGIHHAARTERNFRIELLLAVLAIGLTVIFPLSPVERTVVCLVIGTVLAFELMNTAFEHLMDMLSPQFHARVKIIKDLAAGSVLLVSFSAAVIGIIIFGPYIVALFS